jgi:hypothetical protein
MSPWKSRLIIAALLAGAGAMIADLSMAPRSTFTAENYARLEIGMTMDEVTAILGPPDGVDSSMRDMQWLIWYSPFDSESAIMGIIQYPRGLLASVEQTGHLPNRPLLIPEGKFKREKPAFALRLIKHKQGEQRRATLMLDPPKPKTDPLFLP